MRTRYLQSERAFTFIEMVVTMGLAMVCSSAAMLNLKELNDPLKNGSAEIVSFIKQARGKAISTTSAYTIVPISSTQFKVQVSTTCSATEFEDDERLTLNLPTGAYITDTDWTLCFNARGLPDGTLDVTVRDQDTDYKTVEVFLGGGVRTL